MDDRLAVDGGAPVVNDPEQARFVWPRITNEIRKVVDKQLYEEISIYDNHGIFGEFEDRFAKFHGRKYAQLSNSGTSSILAMYEAIGLQPGDEVLCPVYTFHASVSPMMYLGAAPIFCDSDDEGNISYDDLVLRKTDKTRAVMVTHMWGRPVRGIEKIATFCKRNGLYLLEDCSHAHGAKINDKKVGTFGDMSAWSLQGQKTITGGEGGILTTNDKDLYDRALLQGHYNKRPKKEIDHSNYLYKFYLTGMGLKLRAYPIAIAIANEQFDHLKSFLSVRLKFARMLNAALSRYDFLQTPRIDDDAVYTWYAYGIQYIEEKAFGVSKEKFVDALTAEGLVEVDVPGSTGLLNDLPLFTVPNEILPRLYSHELLPQTNFPNAEKFARQLIKLPVWTFEDEEYIVKNYIKGFEKVCNYILNNKGGL